MSVELRLVVDFSKKGQTTGLLNFYPNDRISEQVTGLTQEHYNRSHATCSHHRVLHCMVLF